MTEYVVLSKDASGYWSEARRINARSAESAIRMFVDGATPDAEVFVAIPARSWQPRKVTLETQTRISLEGL